MWRTGGFQKSNQRSTHRSGRCGLRALRVLDAIGLRSWSPILAAPGGDRPLARQTIEAIDQPKRRTVPYLKPNHLFSANLPVLFNGRHLCLVTAIKFAGIHDLSLSAGKPRSKINQAAKDAIFSCKSQRSGFPKRTAKPVLPPYWHAN